MFKLRVEEVLNFRYMCMYGCFCWFLCRLQVRDLTARKLHRRIDKISTLSLCERVCMYRMIIGVLSISIVRLSVSAYLAFECQHGSRGGSGVSAGHASHIRRAHGRDHRHH